MCRPLYLVSNASGRKYGRWANHFDPYAPMYSRRERSEVMISDFALGAVASGLWGLAKAFGWLWLLKVPSANLRKTYHVLLTRGCFRRQHGQP